MEKGDLKIDSNTVVHCATEELAKQVLKITHNLGYEWRYSISHIGRTFWDVYKEKTCYDINEGTYASFDYCKAKGYKIISAEEFIKLYKNMEEKFYMVYVESENTPTIKHTSKESAEKEAQRLANKLSKKAFVLEPDSMATPDEINIKVDSYEAALEYLGRKSGVCMCGMAAKHAKAMMAMYQLITIAEAWNKADGFIPDFDNTNQYKWFPWFRKQGTAGFVFASTYSTASFAYAAVGSRLCFKSEERANQFGKQFIDLWNDFLLF